MVKVITKKKAVKKAVVVKADKRVPVHIAIVAAKFNDFVTKRLLNACLMELKRLGLRDGEITTVWVPGAFEIPLTASLLAAKKNIDAVICLGAVIQGETYHFRLVANETAQGIMQAGLMSHKPVIMGVLTCETVDQAYQRSQEKGGANKGRDAAQTALDMLSLFKNLK